ncbi:hypothetical protein EDB89DRAFT_2011837, partial [Lactarius sanguifluus]
IRLRLWSNLRPLALLSNTTAKETVNSTPPPSQSCSPHKSDQAYPSELKKVREQRIYLVTKSAVQILHTPAVHPPFTARPTTQRCDDGA